MKLEFGLCAFHETEVHFSFSFRACLSITVPTIPSVSISLDSYATHPDGLLRHYHVRKMETTPDSKRAEADLQLRRKNTTLVYIIVRAVRDLPVGDA
jgi:hypothetical protein